MGVSDYKKETRKGAMTWVEHVGLNKCYHNIQNISVYPQNVQTWIYPFSISLHFRPELLKQPERIWALSEVSQLQVGLWWLEHDKKGHNRNDLHIRQSQSSPKKT